MKKWTKKQVKQLKPYWEKAMKAKEKHTRNIRKIEREMKVELAIDLEFFMVDGEIVGIGNSWETNAKKYKLLQVWELG